MFDLSKLGLINGAKHTIDLKNNDKITCLPNRRLPIAYEDKVEIIIKDLLDKGVIYKSNSSFNSPVVIVPKKDGDLRLCIDYRQLNENTNKPSFYFPDTQEIFDKLGGNNFFTTLDLVKGYYQLEMHKNSSKYTAFTTPSGHYEFARMPFGLCGAPFSFQSALHNILANEDRRICFIYLDDIIIFGKTRYEHDQNLVQILNKLNTAGVKLSKSKCVFSTSSVKYLGHIVSRKGIETDSAKTEQIKNWPTPTTVKEVQSFLGLANYYRKFVKSFSEIAAPLESCLSKKCSKLQWSTEMHESFEKLKTSLTTAPILKYPCNKDVFILDTDASNTGIGAVLSQKDSSGSENVIYYASNRLSKAEQNYCTTRKELLAIFHYTKFFRHYLLGRRFIIRTDHKSLTWLMSWKNPSSSQYFGWISEISQFDFIIQHREGSSHGNADALSRLQECNQCPFKHASEPTNRCLTLSDPCSQLSTTNRHKTISKQDLVKQLDNLSELEINELLKYKQTLLLRNDKVMIKTKFGEVPVVNRSEGYKTAQKLHSAICHLGAERMLSSLEKHIFWIKMKMDCKEISNKCLICAERKAIKSISHEQGNLSSMEPFGKVYMDLAGPLPSHMGYRYILALTDSFSKFVALIPLRTIYSHDICEAFEKFWVSVFGPPAQLHTDNGTNFTSKEMQELCDKYNIYKTSTSPYNPRANGMVERLFRTVKDMAYCLFRETGNRWPLSLHKISLALNLTSSNNKCSAYELLFGRSAFLSNQHLKKLIPATILQKSSEHFIKQCKESDKTDSKKPKLSKGDQVMIRILPKIKQIDLPRYMGPCTVIETKSNGRSIIVNTPNNGRAQRNIRDVKLFTHRYKEIKYEVESILSSKSPADSDSRITIENPRYPSRIRMSPQRFGFS